MIDRINLIKKKSFTLTYAKILTGFGSVFLFCLTLYCVQLLRSHLKEKELRAVKQEITVLKVKKDELISTEAFSMGGTYASLRTRLKMPPVWSEVLNSLADNLPPTAWVGSLKTQRKEETPLMTSAVINGEAKNSQSLALFLEAMRKDAHFSNVVLTTAAAEGDMFNFTVSCDINGQNP